MVLLGQWLNDGCKKRLENQESKQTVGSADTVVRRLSGKIT